MVGDVVNGRWLAFGNHIGKGLMVSDTTVGWELVVDAFADFVMAKAVGFGCFL